MSFVDKFVVGVNSALELTQIINALNVTRPLNFSRFSLSDDELINPINWPTRA